MHNINQELPTAPYSQQLPLTPATAHTSFNLTERQRQLLKSPVQDPRKSIQVSLPKVNKTSLIAKLERHLIDSPNKPLLTYQGQTISYQEIYSAATKLAQHLLSYCKISIGTPVAISGSNKLEFIIAELALLKSGAVFVPIDPNLPESSIEEILNDAGIEHVITCSDNQYNYKNHTTSNIKKSIEIQEENQTIVDFPTIPDSYDAYILYTSGSTTGKPKGVVQTRAGLLGNIKNYTTDLNITANDQFLQLATFSHDQAIVDVFAAILNGSSIHLVDFNKTKMNIQNIKETIKEMRVTIFSSIPLVFKMIFQDINQSTCFPSLRVVTIGGETVYHEHVELFQRIAPENALLINGYGATECSWIASYSIKQTDSIAPHEPVPLGKLTNKIDAILESEEDENPNIGELLISTPYMCKGYHNDASKASFIEKEGKVYYRTGDIVKKITEDDEEIYFLIGRGSGHLKINGERINTFEIEEKLKNNFNVEIENLVVIQLETNDKINEKKIAALVQLKKECKDKDYSFRESAYLFLKPVEIPSEFIITSKIPLLRNGKIDRDRCKKIAARKSNQYSKEDELAYLRGNNYDGYKVKNLSYCKKLASFISRLLNKKTSFIKHDTSLYDLGLTSIDLLALGKFINKLTNIEVSVSELYKHINLGFLDLIDEIEKIKNIEKFKSERPKFLRSDIVYKRYIIEYHSPNFAALKCLSSHFYDKEGISIKINFSKDELLKKVENYIDSDEEDEIAFMFPQVDYKYHHFSSFILSKRENNLYIIDSLGIDNLTYLTNLTECAKKIKEKYETSLNKELKIHVDFIKKQQDDQSCINLTFDYLLNHLRSFKNSGRSLFIDSSPVNTALSNVISTYTSHFKLQFSFCVPSPSSLRFLQEEKRIKNLSDIGLPKFEILQALDPEYKKIKTKKYVAKSMFGKPATIKIDTYFIETSQQFKEIVDRYSSDE